MYILAPGEMVAFLPDVTPAPGAAKARKESWRPLRCCPHSDFHGARDKFQKSVPGIFAGAHLAKPAWKVEAKAAKAKEAKEVKAKEAKETKEAKEAKEKAKEKEKARHFLNECRNLLEHARTHAVLLNYRPEKAESPKERASVEASAFRRGGTL